MKKDNGRTARWVGKNLKVRLPENIDLRTEIQRLRKEKNAVILAHYYQEGAIQDIADFIGDSLGLSQQASRTQADIIVFAGVYFMAETAKILNPSKKILLPDLNSGCSLADSCTADRLRQFKSEYPDHMVVSYVNCSAEVKALSDLVCTSANAEKIINSVPADREIIFVPDKNLGRYLIKKTGREMKLWDGSCVVHEAFSIQKLLDLHKQYPEALIVAHPESEEHVLRVAHYIGSTSGMIDFVTRSRASSFLIATEAGILHQMQRAVPDKKLIPAPVNENNTCACSECASMRLSTMEKIYNCLQYEIPEVTVRADIAARALKPIQRMLELSA
jgi:quinolinate synthase